MFVNSSNKIVRNPHVQDAVGCARQNIDVAAKHILMMKDVDGRDKPGHDDVLAAETSILHLHQIEPLRRRDRAAGGAVACGERCGKIVGAPAAIADPDQ